MFSLDPEKRLSINLSKLFFWKYIHFKPLTKEVFITKDTKGTSSFFASQNTLAIFLGVFHVFSICIESSIQWFNLSCDIVLPNQILMWHIAEADRSQLQHSMLAARDNYGLQLHWQSILIYFFTVIRKDSL